MRAFRLAFVLLLIVQPLLATEYDHSPSLGPQNGYLIVHGGGKINAGIAAKFVDLAGGSSANFILIPTAASDQQLELDKQPAWFEQVFGAKHVTVLHTRVHSRANSEEFVEPLRHASGVWIKGGRQWRLTDAYLGTAVEREIKALLARGGVVGGSSAGATIQGSFLVRGDAGNAKNPDGDNHIMMAPGHEVGFALLENSAIDQHVIVRHREADLDAVVAAHPDLLGIGIDETGAILVHGNSFEVIGDKHVLVHDNNDHNGKRYIVLSPGQKFDLKNRSVM
ncbi:MAG TPA: cyanophycinase [Terriglobales bacterium]|nr:cyanophycinase [Terriglobales bacterium]